MAAGRTHRERNEGQPWYLDAMFYELSVRSFCDGNGDGLGDFRGLTEKLDYLSDLGVDCIWLLPFFASPLCDDGYDVTDYRAVHPALGTIEDVRDFLAAAHERGLRVAAEMVINHTSVDHPWFQAACEAPAGSPLRNFYVWSDAPRPMLPQRRRLRDGDAEADWTWEATAKAFYWHRFGRHQPDLNYDNPAVRAEMLKVLRFWAAMGIDGLCLNGVAYLAERPGANSEHLPENHAVLRDFRRELLRDYPNLMLQAGVNAWPSDAASYFGDGDECHLAPHLPLATRMFLALKQEDRQPLVNILRETPEPPGGCQWVTLLRNHDELTLALATDEERDYLFQEYAADSAMRLHGGIRRRLAPLLDNSRRRMELMLSLLFALPGAPVIYYGDEIGMGDNVFLRGRQAVRTPMQWSADRNGGFSSADFARLAVPPVMDPVYGYQAVNVDAQKRDSSSLLRWMRRLIALRKRHPILARGALELLEPANGKVIAFLRRRSTESDAQGTVLAVANLSRAAQSVEIDLESLAGLTPVEMFGHSVFPQISRSPYTLSLAPHGVFLFELREQPHTVSRLAPVETEALQQVPTIDWPASADAGWSSEPAARLAREVLPAYLRSQRWFGGKARQIESVAIADWGHLPVEGLAAFQLILNVHFAGGGEDLYSLPVCLIEGPEAWRAAEAASPLRIANVGGAARELLLADALISDAFCRWMLAALGDHVSVALTHGKMLFEATSSFDELRGLQETQLPVIRGPATSSNSLVFFGRRLLLKLFRRLAAGTNPDYEVGRFLTTDRRFARTPPVAGKVEYIGPQSSGPFTLGIVQALVPNQGDGWAHAIDELGRFFERAFARMDAPDPLQLDERPLHELAHQPPPPEALETIAGYQRFASRLGRRTAEMHLALASDRSTAEFAPEPLAAVDLEDLKQEIAHQADQAFTALAARVDELPDTVAADAQHLLDEGRKAIDRLTSGWTEVPKATKTRIHGDYHLGQVLWVDNDYVILDFEGEPTRSVDERRRKFSPLRDVAGMLRSYHYAAFAGLFAFTEDRPDDFPRLEPWANLWQQWTRAAFLAEYERVATGSEFLPGDRSQLAILLDAFTLAKALYELAYELNNRPDWVRIPLSGVLRLLNLTTPAGAG